MSATVATVKRLRAANPLIGERTIIRVLELHSAGELPGQIGREVAMSAGAVARLIAESGVERGGYIGDSAVGQRLPAEPLAQLLNRAIDDDGVPVGQIAKAAGTTEKRLYEIRKGRTRSVLLATADRVCCALEVPLASLYRDA